MTRIRLGDTEPVGALFLDDAGAGVTGLTPVLHVRRAADGTFWDGDSYEATPTDLAMAEVDAVNAAGEYQHSLTPGAAGKHFLTAFAAAGGPPYPASVVAPVQPGELDVGGWADELDAPVSSVTRRMGAEFALEAAAADLVIETPDVELDVEVTIETEV